MTAAAGLAPAASTTARPADKGTSTTLAGALPPPDEATCRRLLALLAPRDEPVEGAA